MLPRCLSFFRLRITTRNPRWESFVVLLLVLCGWHGAWAGPTALVSGGVAKAVIVAPDGGSDHFVATELQRYIELLSGAKPEIVSVEQARQRARNVAWILVGSPQSNELVGKVSGQKLVNLTGLKADGFVLKTISLEGHPSLLVGGNDEAGTMYGAYDLIERYGAVFLLTGDILPAKQPNLEFRETRRKARAMAEKWSETIDHPSDLGVLYRINLFMVTGTELAFDFIEGIDNFHHGHDYAKPVAFDKIFVDWPVLKAAR